MRDSTPSETAPAPARPAPESGEKFDRLQALLREMFQLDRGDLDFGLYRIMNLKAGEIAAFLDDDLLPQVKAKLKLTSDEERAGLEEELAAARKQARGLGLDPDFQTPPRIVELNRRLAEMKKDADAEADVYNHLANFFARYYVEGDFISQRRYSSGGRSAYLIPYDGEEVKLHWANADQYYVKTTENYAAYAFTVGAGDAGRRVRFEIAAADNEKDNLKEADGRQRRFVLAGDKGAVAVEGGDLVVRFEHRPLTDGERRAYPGNGYHQQNRINEAAAQRILDTVDSDWRALLAAPAPTDANGERTLLAKHIERYTAKNSFDYFIHKNLGGFLRRELDLYLNTEVLNLDDLEQGDAARLDRALARVRAVRHVGGKIIDFLAQLEDFQKRLWLKRKFVLETHWCVTLDRVPEAMYPEIAANAAQRAEWVKLFAVDEIEGDLANGGATWSDPPSVDFLKANPYLVLDTRHFDRDFTDRLLAVLSDAGPLDEQQDGLLLHGENFQALNLLQARYRGQVKCVYIDPPYNTSENTFVYKNAYKHSSWLAMIQTRVEIAKFLLHNKGVLQCAIDDTETWKLRSVLDTCFGQNNRVATIAVEVNPAGQNIRPNTPALSHDYCHVYANDIDQIEMLLRGLTVEEKEMYRHKDEIGFFLWDNLRRRGGNSRPTDRPGQWYPLYIDRHTKQVSVNSFEGSEEVWPIDAKGERRIWRNNPDGARRDIENGEISVIEKAGKFEVVKKSRMPGGKKPKTLWADSNYSATTYGTKLLIDIVGNQQFSYPKSLHLVMDCLRYWSGGDSTILDFFAGSGTTGHAVINLNREDGGQREYVLVEVGHHFDTVLLPRLKKIIYSPDWKDGKPVSRKGVTQLFKYVRLESYEDTLDGLEVTPQSHEQNELLAENPALAEDYRLRYALGAETSGSPCLLGKAFIDPFAYTLSVVRDGARRFIAGWNSWRVSTMGLMHVGVGEGPEIIQMFGRGVRLKGWNMSLKRHRKSGGEPPPDSDQLVELEKLYIFGLRSNYMQTFRDLLQKEGMRAEQETIRLPVTWNFARKTDLKLIRLKEGTEYRHSDVRPVLPDPGGSDSPTVTLDLYSRLQAVAAGDDAALDPKIDKSRVTLKRHAALFDGTRVYDVLLARKRQARWHNLTIPRATADRLLESDGWYDLHMPSERLKVTRFEDVQKLEDVAVDLISAYADRFWRRERRRWEHDRIEVATLDKDDPNNIGEYLLSADATEDRLIEDINALKSNVRDGYFRDLKLGVIDRQAHAYRPLLYADKECKVTIQPVALDGNEKTVVEKLADLTGSGYPCLRGRELFLIRNLTRGRGVSFFDDFAYYPDFIVWLKDDDCQHVVFLDPKGLVRYGPRARDKVRLHAEIKEIEHRVRQLDPKLRLHAYVLSVTPPGEIGDVSRQKSEWEQDGVYFLQDSDCLQRMIAHALASAP